jgi:PKD repeat protein
VDDDGFGYVLFDASSCGGVCNGTTAVKIPVIKSTGTIKGIQYVCPNSGNKYTLPAWPGTVFNWSLSSSSYGYLSHTDQPNEIVFHAGSTSGTVTLHCDYTNSLVGCGGSADFTINILAPDSIVGPSPVCKTSTNTYYLYNSHTGNWTLTAPNGTTTTYSSTSSISPTFTQAGTYSLSVSGTTFCSPPALAITVLDLPPVPDFLSGPDTVCLNVPYTFTAGNPLPGTYFDWTVTGGGISGSSFGNNVTIIFTATSGPLSVTVVRKLKQSPYCAGPTLSKTVYRPNIAINITGKDTVCPNSVWAYNSGYYNGETYVWSISNPLLGSIDDVSKPNINVTWNNQTGTSPTTATLKLKVTRCGVTDSQTFNVVIKPVPALSLSSADSVCRDAPITVTLTPSLSSGSLDWSLPGSAITTIVTITPSSPSSAFQDVYTFHDISSGNLIKHVSVTVTNPNGCPGKWVVGKDIVLKPAPIALVTPLGPMAHCGSFSDTLTATLQSGIGRTASLTWMPGSFAFCTAPSFSCAIQTVTAYGNYYVIATDSNGCTSQSNVVKIVKSCGGTGDTGGCAPANPPTITASASENCGHVTITVSYPSTGYSSGPIINPSPLALNLTTSGGSPGSTPAQVDADFEAAGQYDFSFDYYYLDNNNQPCLQRVYKSVVVPVVPDLMYKLTCTNGSGFSIEVDDHSTYFPGVTGLTYAYKLDAGSWTSPSSALSHTYSVSANATHTLYLVVGYTYGGVSKTCTTSRSVVVPGIPSASFTAGPIVPACILQQSINFTNTSTGATTYLWDFADGSTSTITSPTKTYATASSWDVTLVASNGFGCNDSATTTITTVSNQLAGTLSASPAYICDGSTSVLTYTNSGTSTPTAYKWMNDVNPIYTSTTNTLSVNQSGQYWVHVSNQYGCWMNTNTSTVTVIYVPDPLITGDSLQCEGNTFTLYGNTGTATYLSYQWYRNGFSVGTTPNLVQTGLSPGTYNYQLVLSATSVGINCAKSAFFTVVVHATPSAPTIGFNVTNCNPYTIDVSASPSSSGTYNWSNGMTGNPITTYVGGPYKVWYTDDYGCTVSAEDYVAKDPQGYLWIFPTGCYIACPSVTIPGPIIAFTNWYYYDATGPILSGSNSIPSPLTLSVSGKYGMFLDNGWCTAQIDTLDITFRDSCNTCVGITGSLVMEYDAACQVFPYFSFTNSTGAAATYVITSNIGTMAAPNNSGTIPTGSSGFNDRWIPPTGFVSGWVTFTVTVTKADHTTCIMTFTKWVACPHGGPVHKLAAANSNILLTLAPNPAQNSTVVTYKYATDAKGAARSIELYDITGRRLTSFIPSEEAWGVWNLSLDNIAAGVYQVVMKDHGASVANVRLTVAR